MMSCVLCCLVCCLVVLCGVRVFYFFFFSILFFLFLALSPSFLFFPYSVLSSSFSSLFNSRQQTLCKVLINKREYPSLLLSPPSSLPLRFQRTKKKRGDFLLQEYFRRGIYFLLTVLNKFQKIAAGENYSHYSFILIQKQ